MDKEIWRPVNGFEEAYEVSSNGNIRSLPRTVARGNHTLTVKGRDLNFVPHTAGYHKIALHRGGIRHMRYVHHLVLEAFVGPAPPGTECCHRNGNPSDNRAVNLYWGSHARNAQDTARHGRLPHGEMAPWSKLNVRQARIIARLALSRRTTQREISEIFGVSQGAVRDILRRKNWRRVTEDIFAEA